MRVSSRQTQIICPKAGAEETVKQQTDLREVRCEGNKQMVD